MIQKINVKNMSIFDGIKIPLPLCFSFASIVLSNKTLIESKSIINKIGKYDISYHSVIKL